MAENKNMTLYDARCTPPNDATKPIGAGKLKGKRDINPQWRYEALTSQLGPCGIGWKFTIDNHWTQPVEKTGETMIFVMVTLYIKQGDSWSEGIPAYGGDFLIVKDRNGYHGNDEAMKMAITDALGTACKYVGVAADVYRGLLDGIEIADTKYARRSQQETQQPAQSKQTNNNDAVRNQAIRKADAEYNRLKLNNDDCGEIIYRHFNVRAVNGWADLSDKQIIELTENFEKWANELHVATTWAEDHGVPNQ
jgi:hypothetical protein